MDDRYLSLRKSPGAPTDFDEGSSTAISFLIATPFGERGFRLPANIDAVLPVMTRQYQHRQIERRYATREQAARVGWRIIKDWLEVQLAIIETEMVTLDQVMLPYMTNHAGKTVYQIMVDQQLALPTGAVNQGENK